MELSELIESVDIAEYIGQFVDLQYKSGELWGLSPFKDEKTPSFSVRPEDNVFYDFSSGTGGNVINFIMLYFNVEIKEAIEKLEEYAGVKDGSCKCQKQLLSTSICKKFSKKKGKQKECIATPLADNCMNKFEIRNDKLQVWMDEGISKESLDKFNVRYDPYSNRIVYPIKNYSGQIVNIGGRTLDPDYKEKGLRKYMYFYKWGSIDVIYGLYDNLEYIKQKKEIIIFEGAKSVLLADTWGIHNCAAILTSHLNENQMRQLIRLGCNVVFALDKDANVCSDKNVRRLKSFVNISVISDSSDLLGCKDAPVDKGKEVFELLYESRFRLKYLN